MIKKGKIEMKEYNAKATSLLFWLQESRITAQYILKGTSKRDLVSLSKDENIYNAVSDDRKHKIANTTYNRVSSLPEDLIGELATCNVDEAEIINFKRQNQDKAYNYIKKVK